MCSIAYIKIIPYIQSLCFVNILSTDASPLSLPELPPLAPITKRWLRDHGSAPVHKRRKLAHDGPRRCSSRIQSRMATETNLALDLALNQAIEVESFQLDPVAQRLKEAREKKCVSQTLICIHKCGCRDCRHPKRKLSIALD